MRLEARLVRVAVPEVGIVGRGVGGIECEGETNLAGLDAQSSIEQLVSIGLEAVVLELVGSGLSAVVLREPGLAVVSVN